jgi:hypothetical protein
MKRGYFIALVGACTGVFAAALVARSDSSVNAVQAPRKGCVAVVKQEYDSAKRLKLLQMKYSSYAMTGGLGRRSYWYCRS